MISYIAAIEFFPNCPIHDSSEYSRMEAFEQIDNIADFVINNLNAEHIMDIKSFTDDEITVEYDRGGHSFIGATLVLNGIRILRTVDDGHGRLVWKPINV